MKSANVGMGVVCDNARLKSRVNCYVSLIDNSLRKYIGILPTDLIFASIFLYINL